MGHNKGDVKIQSLLNCVGVDFTVCGLLMPLALFSASRLQSEVPLKFLSLDDSPALSIW